jgi:tripartite-type tricarboxylate transporter receptor subunit TctC
MGPRHPGRQHQVGVNLSRVKTFRNCRSSCDCPIEGAIVTKLLHRRQFLHLAAGAAALPAVSRIASAQAYPSRPISMIVPFPAGGNTDIMARALQNEMSRALGQIVIITNKGGAAGTLGILDLIKAAPDGYTIALTPNNPLTAQPHLQKLAYSVDSFRYICLTYYAPYVLIAGPKAPFETFDEFVKFAKAKPENLVYGHAGPASPPYLR